MTYKLVLTTPYFKKVFILECDASSIKLGAVLLKDGRSISFESKNLKDRDLANYTYV